MLKGRLIFQARNEMIKEWPIALGPLGKATNAELVHLDGERGLNTRTHEVCYQGLELISSENQEDCVQLELLVLIYERQGTAGSTMNSKFHLHFSLSSVAQMVKIPPAVWETQVQSLGRKLPWRREWQPTSVFVPGESHGQRSLVGYSPWGRKELDPTE